MKQKIFGIYILHINNVYIQCMCSGGHEDDEYSKGLYSNKNGTLYGMCFIT